MHGSFELPYPRTACSTYIPDCKDLLDLYFDRASLIVPKYVNNTLVNGIAPAPLVSPPSNWPCCASMPVTAGQYDGTNNGASPPPWGTWEMYPPVPANTFEESGTVNLGQCPEEGWKAVACRRSFHGCYGMDTSETNDGSCYDIEVPKPDTSACLYLSERGAPPSVKYLTCKRTCRGVATTTTNLADPDPGSPTYGEGIMATQIVTFEESYTISVNPLSGEATIDSRTYSDDFTVTSGARNLRGFYTDPPLAIFGPYDKVSVLAVMGYIDGCSGKFSFPISTTFDLSSVSSLTDILWYNTLGRLARRNPGAADADSVAYGSGFMMAGAGWSWSDVSVSSAAGGYKWEFFDGDGVKGTESTCIASLDDQSRYVQCDSSTTQPGISWSGSLKVGFELSNPHEWSSVSSDMDTLLGHLPLNDKLLLQWRKDGGFGTLPLVSRNELKVPVSPKDNPPGFVASTGTVDDLTSPINDSLGNAPFSGSWSPTYDQTDWFDPRCYVWKFNPGETSATAAAIGRTKIVDGNILGSPLLKDDGSSDLVGGKIPYGRDKYFDFRKENWASCIDGPECTDTGATIRYIKSYGDWTPVIFSGAIKQWTNEVEQLVIPPGASSGRYHNADLYWTPQNWRVKCAVTMPTGLPAQNLFGASGAHRFALDEDKTWCASSISGSVITLDPYGTAPAFAADTLVLICDTGDSALDGVYPGTVSGTWEITLGTKKWDLPGGYTRNHGGSDDPTATIGVLRFPAAYPIRGRARVKTATQDGAKVILEMGAQSKTAFGDFKYLRDGDVVDCVGISGLGASLTWERVDDTHGKVTGTLAGDYIGDGFLISHGAPDYKWDTNVPRKTYLLLKWLSEWRSFQERDRAIAQYEDCVANCTDGDCSPVAPADSTQIRPLQGGRGLNQSVEDFEYTEACLKFSNCSPQVVCISPNEETWPRGITYAFVDASSVVPDELYGGPIWQSTPVIAMTELLTQTPAIPCIDDLAWTLGGWKADNGGCLEDDLTVKYYPVPALVEPMATLFGGQPALPAGMYLGWLSVSDMNAGSLPAGNVTPNPPPGGKALALPFDWLGNTQACIVGGGRFAVIYSSYYE